MGGCRICLRTFRKNYDYIIETIYRDKLYDKNKKPMSAEIWPSMSHTIGRHFRRQIQPYLHVLPLRINYNYNHIYAM